MQEVDGGEVAARIEFDPTSTERRCLSYRL